MPETTRSRAQTAPTGSTAASGTDQIYGDIAGCSVFCEPDVDLLFARDGERDIVNCGGLRIATVDHLDVAGNCASVDRQALAVAGAGTKCKKAKRKLRKAKKKLKALKANDAKRKAITKQKKRVKKAKKAKKRACS